MFSARSVGVLLHLINDRKSQILWKKSIFIYSINLKNIFHSFADCKLNDTFGIFLFVIKT